MSKLQLDLKNLLNGFDELIDVLLENETFNETLSKQAQSLKLNVKKFRNEHNYPMEQINSDDSFTLPAVDLKNTSDCIVTTSKDNLNNLNHFQKRGPTDSSSGATSSNSSEVGYPKENDDDNSKSPMDANSIHRTSIKKEVLTHKNHTKFIDPKHTWCLYKTLIKGKSIYLLYIYNKHKIEKHALFVKDLNVSLENNKLLKLKYCSIELKYEAESPTHAKDWMDAINKYKNPITYEDPLNLSQSSPTEETIKNDEIGKEVESMKKPDVGVFQHHTFKEPPEEILNMGFKKSFNECKDIKNIATASTITSNSASVETAKSHGKSQNLMHELSGMINKKNKIKSNNTTEKNKITVSEPENKLITSHIKETKIPLEITESIYDSIPNIETKHDDEEQNYENTGYEQLFQNHDILYMCIYDSKLKDSKLDLKRGSIVQMMEKVSDNLFIGKYLDMNNKFLFGLVSFDCVIKVYTKN